VKRRSSGEKWKKERGEISLLEFEILLLTIAADLTLREFCYLSVGLLFASTMEITLVVTIHRVVGLNSSENSKIR
jgi:hypothetical protein